MAEALPRELLAVVWLPHMAVARFHCPRSSGLLWSTLYSSCLPPSLKQGPEHRLPCSASNFQPVACTSQAAADPSDFSATSRLSASGSTECSALSCRPQPYDRYQSGSYNSHHTGGHCLRYQHCMTTAGPCPLQHLLIPGCPRICMANVQLVDNQPTLTSPASPWSPHLVMSPALDASASCLPRLLGWTLPI